MSILITAAVVALYAWIFGYEHCWHRYVAPLRERLKIVEAERELLRVLAFDEPQPERTYDVALVNRITLEPIGAERVAIRHHTATGAQN